VALVFSTGPTFAADKPSIETIRGDDIGQGSVTMPEFTSLGSTLPDVPSQPGTDSKPSREPLTLLLLGSGLVGISTLERRFK
jgi:hypothetical protein